MATVSHNNGTKQDITSSYTTKSALLKGLKTIFEHH